MDFRIGWGSSSFVIIRSTPLLPQGDVVVSSDELISPRVRSWHCSVSDWIMTMTPTLSRWKGTNHSYFKHAASRASLLLVYQLDERGTAASEEYDCRIGVARIQCRRLAFRQISAVFLFHVLWVYFCGQFREIDRVGGRKGRGEGGGGGDICHKGTEIYVNGGACLVLCVCPRVACASVFSIDRGSAVTNVDHARRFVRFHRRLQGRTEALTTRAFVVQRAVPEVWFRAIRIPIEPLTQLGPSVFWWSAISFQGPLLSGIPESTREMCT